MKCRVCDGAGLGTEKEIIRDLFGEALLISHYGDSSCIPCKGTGKAKK